VALSDFLNPLLSWIKRALGPFGTIFDHLAETWRHVISIFSDSQHLIDTVLSEIEAWKNFRETPNFKNRIISLPIAIEKTTELIQGIPDAWHAIIDIVNEIRSKITGVGETPTDEAEAAVSDVEHEGVSGILRSFPKLARGLEKVVGFLSILVDALASISKGILDLQTIVDETARIRREIEDLDSIFLQQKNPRRTVKLLDGGSIKIRVGKLHS
jgi:hypothetical protein